jgi:tripartite-type tricarboxylate transporter receptor subunit TctC
MFTSGNRRVQAILAAALLLLSLLGSVPASAQQSERYPTRPITFIVPFATGTPFESVLRLVLDEASKALGQPVLLVNMTGGNFTIAASAIAKAKPDGYTIGYPGSSALFITPFLQSVPFDPVKDFRSIAQISTLTFGVVVRGDSPFKDIQQMVAYARQNPQKLTYGSTGANSIQFFAMEYFLKGESAQVLNIPYRGSADVSTALLGGVIDMGATLPNYPDVASGRNRLLLLLTDGPAKEFPNVPSLKDLGHTVPVPAFVGASGPSALPDEIVATLEAAFAKAVAAPAVVSRAEMLHIPLTYRNSRDLDDYVARSYAVYKKLVSEFRPPKEK